MMIVSPHQVIYEYVFEQIGTTLTEGGQAFKFYQQPPENENEPYIWFNVSTLNDSGPRDGYIYEMLGEFTVVAYADVNRSEKDTLLLGQTGLLKLFTTRGLNQAYTTAQGVTVNLISQTLSSLVEGSETLGQKKLNFAKVNINFTLTF